MNWFDNEFKMAADFAAESAPIIAGIEAYETKLEELRSQRDELKPEIGKAVLFESRKAVLEGNIHFLETANYEAAKMLQQIKEKYFQEEIVDTLETLAGVDEGEEISDDACRLLMRINELCSHYLSQADRSFYN